MINTTRLDRFVLETAEDAMHFSTAIYCIAEAIYETHQLSLCYGELELDQVYISEEDTFDEGETIVAIVAVRAHIFAPVFEYQSRKWSFLNDYNKLFMKIQVDLLGIKDGDQAFVMGDTFDVTKQYEAVRELLLPECAFQAKRMVGDVPDIWKKN